MRPWRDIYSVPEWEHFTQSLFAKTKDPKIGQLTGAIRAYHAIDKQPRDNLEDRVGRLKMVHMLALDYLRAAASRKNVDYAKLEEEVKKVRLKERLKGQQVPSHLSHYKTKTQDGVIWVLSRRAARKIHHLIQLQAYYRDLNAPLVRPSDLIKHLAAPERREGELLGLCNSVLMERLDPYHRTYDVTFTNGTVVADGDAISFAFRDWVLAFQEGDTTAPFFLWLESHPICTAGDNGCFEALFVPTDPNYVLPFHPKDVRRVSYETTPVGLLMARGGLLYQWMNEELSDWFLVGDNECGGTPFDTGWVTASKEGAGFAAFVWTKAGELMVARHQPGRFHHSSFVSGDAVRCAGMIKVAHGKVTAVSNNSGHYKPPKGHLEAFVKHLGELGVLGPNPKVIFAG